MLRVEADILKMPDELPGTSPLGETSNGQLASMRLPCLLAVQWLLIRQVNRYECTDLQSMIMKSVLLKVL